MTDEQIKQNAETAYPGFEDLQAVYIEGAHSLDEEIKELNGQVALHKDRADYYHDLYMKLRNPWISVEERLPEKDETDLDSVICELSIEVLVASDEYPHRALAYYDYQDKKWRMSNSPLESIKGVTHWMPIPQVPNNDN